TPTGYVIKDAESIGIFLRDKVTSYRVVIEPMEFYRLTPGSEQLKPSQETPIPGLTLAGDYTKQKYLATMEGAVYSGKLAAKAVAEAGPPRNGLGLEELTVLTLLLGKRYTRSVEDL